MGLLMRRDSGAGLRHVDGSTCTGMFCGDHMKIMGVRFSLAMVLLAGVAFCGGCASSSESAQRDALTENVGKYPPAPQGVNKPRVGVPPFSVQAQGMMAGGDLNDLAADQMTSLLFLSDRFNVIERTQLQKLLDEQNLEGIVRPGELAKPGQVRGVDFLLLGKVTNLAVKTERKQRGFGLAQVGGLFGGADYKKTEITITTSCGVDIRLVDPTTGEVKAANFSEYTKTDAASAIGLDILGASADADANIQFSEDDKGKILRLALDDAVKKSLPQIDKFLRSPENQSKETQSAGPVAPVTPAMPVAPAAVTPAEPAAAKKFCPQCGKEVPAGVKFCPNCGAKVG